MAHTPNSETLIPKFWENIDCWHYGASRLLPWDHFKPYLSQFEPVVWILETWKDQYVTFRSSDFGRYSKFGDPIPKIWGNIDCWHHGSSRLLPWDHFKPYLSQFEPVVRILET